MFNLIDLDPRFTTQIEHAKDLLESEAPQDMSQIPENPFDNLQMCQSGKFSKVHKAL